MSGRGSCRSKMAARRDRWYMRWSLLGMTFRMNDHEMVIPRAYKILGVVDAVIIHHRRRLVIFISIPHPITHYNAWFIRSLISSACSFTELRRPRLETRSSASMELGKSMTKVGKGFRVEPKTGSIAQGSMRLWDDGASRIWDGSFGLHGTKRHPPNTYACAHIRTHKCTWTQNFVPIPRARKRNADRIMVTISSRAQESHQPTSSDSTNLNLQL